MNPHIELVNGYTLFVGTATDRITAANILEENTDKSPLGLMFRGAGVCRLDFGRGQVLNVPYRKVNLDDPALTVQDMLLEVDGKVVAGMGIGLPADVLRLQGAWERIDAAWDKSNVQYDREVFLKSYLGDIEKIGSLAFEHIDTTRIDGMMAQVISSPLMDEDEVGLSAATMEKLHRELIAVGHDELEDVDDLDLMIVQLQRSPVVSPDGARWVKLRLVKSAPSDKLLVNPVAWMELHDGDDDGDTGFIGICGSATFSH